MVSVAMARDPAAAADLLARGASGARQLDLYALADFLTRPPGHRYFGKAVAALKDRLERAAPP